MAKGVLWFSIWKRKASGFFLILVVVCSSLSLKVIGWHADETEEEALFEKPCFSTHQWLAWEAIKLFPEAKITWITENLYAFWHGVEAPFMPNASFAYGYTNGGVYGDIEELSIGLEQAGIEVLNSSLADRAQEEYSKLLTELKKEESNYQKAAFYAGTMAHYISQAGIWKALWNETKWGELNITIWLSYEGAIEAGLGKERLPKPTFNYRFTNLTDYYNEFFALSPIKKQPITAWNATVALAKQVYPMVENLAMDFNATIMKASDWPTEYYNMTKKCLTYAVEAIYAALEKAMLEVNWRYLIIPRPVAFYDNTTNLLNLSEMEVRYVTSTGTHILNESSMATLAEAWFIFYDSQNNPLELSSNPIPLQFNSQTGKWSLTNTLARWLKPNCNTSVIVRFDMPRAAPTWSNLSKTFFIVSYFNVTFTSIDFRYSDSDWILDIYNITAFCELPEVGMILPEDIYKATWTLYQYGMGFTTPINRVGYPKKDIFGNVINGNLTYNENASVWEALNIDLGWVVTFTGTILYVVIDFYLNVPVGSSLINWHNDVFFYPFARGESTNIFVTRPHLLTVSVPQIVYDSKKKILNAYNITAYDEYNNTRIDHYYIHEMPIDPNIEDIREAHWRIFTKDLFPSYRIGDLLWDPVKEWWYVEGISLDGLPDGEYCLRVRFITLVNDFYGYDFYSEPSALVKVTTEPNGFIILTPAFFFVGFIVLPILVVSIRMISAKNFRDDSSGLTKERKK